MSMSMSMRYDEPQLADVLALIEEVWRSFVGVDEPLLPAEPDTGSVAYAATVTITGGWDGAVTLEFGVGTAEAVSARMLGLDEITEADVADAIGELVNMVGGNVKSLMPGPSALSLPVVSTGRIAHSNDTVEVCRCELSWAGLPMAASVHAHRD
jgi:chemotaxis protein CheX